MRHTQPLQLFCVTLFLIAKMSHAQIPRALEIPLDSPKASVMQRIGFTDITINYHSPAVKGRELWGKFIQYGRVWRAGSNDNTTIAFTHDVRIENQLLTAGIYGLHMIPDKEEWTIIFSKNYTSWGSFFYDEKEDALRVKVKPIQTAESREWLSYDFLERESDHTTAVLYWEKLKIPFKIEVNTPAIVADSFRKQLRSSPAFTWEGPANAAKYCLEHNFNLDEALLWVDNSIKANKNYTNLKIKADLLAKQGKSSEAQLATKEAVERANAAELSRYATELLNSGKVTEALEIAKINVKKYPADWQAHFSLGAAHEKSGDKKQAMKNFEKALENAPNADTKNRISGKIKQLSAS